MIDGPKELWEKRLNNLFKKKEKTETQKFLDIVSIILYSNDICKDVSELYAQVDLDTFIKVISTFEGRTIKFPTKTEIKDSIELALLFYYKNIQGVENYKDLKTLNIMDEKDFSSISIGKRLSKLSKNLQDKILDMYLEMENNQ